MHLIVCNDVAMKFWKETNMKNNILSRLLNIIGKHSQMGPRKATGKSRKYCIIL